MALISTKMHAVGDYAGGAAMLAASNLPFVRDRRAAALLRVAGASAIVGAALTDNELGLLRKVPMRVHLALDALGGAVMTSSALALRGAGVGVGSWAPHLAIGISQVAGAAVTERTPSGRSTDGIPAPPHVTGEGVAAREPGVPVAPAPVETPGPSVNAPAQPASDVERAERVDATLPDAASDDDLVAQQEAAAAAEAASIGGPAAPEGDDPAFEAVNEAGGGEQEGFEQAEADLVENATHGDGRGNPMRDALTPEVESDQSRAVAGEGDQEAKPDE
jgi:hypothetical protein